MRIDWYRRRAGERVEGLVVWRALLMLGGLVVHATIGSENQPGMAAITTVSSLFRMGCFFMISGMLSALALMRRGDVHGWLRERLVQLGIPTLFGVAVLCPLTAMMMPYRAGQPVFVLYHLWFMVALLGYLVIGYALHLLGLNWSIFDQLERRAWRGRGVQVTVLGVIAVLSFNLMVAALSMTDRWVPEAQLSLVAQGWLAAGYAPMFLLGFILARAPTLCHGFTARRSPPLAILAAIGLTNIVWRAGLLPPIDATLHAQLDQLIRVGSAALAPPAAGALILRSARRTRRVPAILRRLSEASFTMYLLHYPLMVAIKRFAAPAGWGPWPMFWMALLGGGALSYALYAGLVRRSAILSLLLAGQGRRPKAARPMRSQPAIERRESGEILSPGAPRSESGGFCCPAPPAAAGIPFCCPVGSDRAILE